MILFDHAARQIAGAWKMAMDADDWRASLDRSLDGVFQSLSAVLFAAPLIALRTLSARQAAIRISDDPDPFYAAAPLAGLIAGDLVAFSLDWAASLTLLVLLARASGAGRQAADIIVGYNWIQPIVVALQLPAVALMAATASRTLGGLVGLPALAIILTLIWGVVRRGLGAQIGPSAAVVVLLVLVGAVIDLLSIAAMKALFVGQS